MIPKHYLGDGVSVEVERGLLKLTAENGSTVTNTIYLDHPVYANLQEYYYRAVAEARDLHRAAAAAGEDAAEDN